MSNHSAKLDEVLKLLVMIHPLLARDFQAGWTPLMVAAGNGHTPFMRFLLEEGANPDIANAVGR